MTTMMMMKIWCSCGDIIIMMMVMMLMTRMISMTSIMIIYLTFSPLDFGGSSSAGIASSTTESGVLAKTNK